MPPTRYDALSASARRHMRRRQFLGLVSGAAAAWPVVARAQAQQQSARFIGFLYQGSEDSPVMRARIDAFRAGLIENGYVEGQNIQIVYRNAPEARQLLSLAKELADSKVAIIA